MAYGKITFTPVPDYALSLPETKYLELADTAALDAGAGDLSLSCIFKPDSTMASPANAKLLAGKGPRDLTGAAGWYVGLVPNIGSVEVSLNDGSATQLYINSPNGSFVLDEAYWLHVGLDRSANVSMWLGRFSTGVLTNIKNGAISSRPGSLSNSNALWMGNWGASAGYYYKGLLSLVRLDIGRLLPDAWIAEEWLRVKWGLARKALDFTACWPFDESLVDLSSAGYTPSYLPSGIPVYVSGYPTALAPLTYIFSQNIGLGHAQGNVPHYQVERARDGTAYAYGQTVKRRWAIPFAGITPDQLFAFQSAYEGAQPIQFHKDATHPSKSTLGFYIMDDPEASALATPEERYNLTLTLEEA